jgi:hypothetical protein
VHRRTTITLDEDARAALEQVRRNTGKTFKEVVNESIRLGCEVQLKARPRRRFVVKPLPLKLPKGLSYDKVDELLDYLEGPIRR